MASIAKRTWKSPDGTAKSSFTVRWHDAAGVHKQETFRSKKEASSFKLKIENQIAERGYAATRTSETVADLCDTYMRHQEVRVRDGRIGARRYDIVKNEIDASILPGIGKVKVGKIREQDVEDWYNWMCRRGLKPSTARARLKTLDMIFERALSRKEASHNPVPAVAKSLRGVVAAPVRTFTKQEMMQLLKSLETRSSRRPFKIQEQMRCVVHLGAFCGLRFGEILALKIENVDLDRRILRVRHNFCRKVGLKTTKTTAGVRDVPIPPHLVMLLAGYISQRYVENDEGLIFHPPGGPNPSSYNNLHAQWLRTLDHAGLAVKGSNARGLHFHALRHFAASWWIENGVPLMDVAKMLGHRTFDMTLQVYAHQVDPSAHRHAIIDRMASLLVDDLAIDEDAVPGAVAHALRIEAQPLQT